MNHKQSSRGTWRISIDSRGAMMDRVNSFRGCFLKDQGFVPPPLFVRSIFVYRSSKILRLEIYLEIQSIFQIILRALDRSSLRQLLQIAVPAYPLHIPRYIQVKSHVRKKSFRGVGIDVLRRFIGRQLLDTRASSRATSRESLSVLARSHRVSPVSANSHDTPRVHVLGRYAPV